MPRGKYKLRELYIVQKKENTCLLTLVQRDFHLAVSHISNLGVVPALPFPETSHLVGCHTLMVLPTKYLSVPPPLPCPGLGYFSGLRILSGCAELQ